MCSTPIWVMILIISVSNFHNLFKNYPNDSYKQTLLGGRSNEKKYRIQILESNMILLISPHDLFQAHKCSGCDDNLILELINILFIVSFYPRLIVFLSNQQLSTFIGVFLLLFTFISWDYEDRSDIIKAVPRSLSYLLPIIRLGHLCALSFLTRSWL